MVAETKDEGLYRIDILKRDKSGNAHKLLRLEKETGFGKTTFDEHGIDTGNATPINQPPQREESQPNPDYNTTILGSQYPQMF
ncbi:hypothetical protein CHS0354_024735 [Potamilus streckersoni]|uniref:Uncharacterized protein n=1 Tax=Potamilus streckersoni TaxID=2493646 RepID=A0AAE0RX31_9BIVA|nr:hypothetical protein CHS0354_024735 [Potamilus streckersoni]